MVVEELCAACATTGIVMDVNISRWGPSRFFLMFPWQGQSGVIVAPNGEAVRN
jgi:hypothetical protein